MEINKKRKHKGHNFLDQNKKQKHQPQPTGARRLISFHLFLPILGSRQTKCASQQLYSFITPKAKSLLFLSSFLFFTHFSAFLLFFFSLLQRNTKLLLLTLYLFLRIKYFYKINISFNVM